VSVDYRGLTLADGPAVLTVMQAASGGLGRLPEEMDLAWVVSTWPTEAMRMTCRWRSSSDG